MLFALLLSQFPHVDDAGATKYADMLVLASQPHRVRQVALAVWSMVSKLVS